MEVYNCRKKLIIMAEDEHLTAEDYVAEAMAADMDPWFTFDARKTPRAEFSGWLESYRPSQGPGGPVGWITVLGPQLEDDFKDVEGLQDSWDTLLESGRSVSYHSIRELALNHSVLQGKWLMHLDTGFKVDRAWQSIARAILDGKIRSAKVSTRDPSSERHVICVYNQNFTDEEQVMRLDAAIRCAGVKCALHYKPDVYTHLGIYRNNRWRICPTIYESVFDLESVPRRSRVTNKITNQEVT